VHLLPSEYLSEGILHDIGEVEGLKVLLPRAETVRPVLVAGLKDKGALVSEVIAYRIAPGRPAAGVAAKMAAGVDLVVLTSPSIAENFVKMTAGLDYGDPLIACIGPITAAAARAHGLRVDLVPRAYSLESLLESLALLEAPSEKAAKAVWLMRQAGRYMPLSAPEVWHELMEKLATVVGRCLRPQARAGAQALQVFDTWAGCLSPADYERFVLPYTRKAIATAAGAGVPIINFALGAGTFLDVVGAGGGQALGIDWRGDVGAACARFRGQCGIQGNLDPSVLLGPGQEVRRQVTTSLAAVSARLPGRVGYVFNLGHGILPQTPPDNVRVLVEAVKTTPAA
jgi:Uroporphyrinogen decarboxylase (URO-D)/Uroporphyrinogen-III synthase HemD